MKCTIHGPTDYFPFYAVEPDDEPDDESAEIPDDLMERYRKAVAEMEAVTELLRPYGEQSDDLARKRLDRKK